MKIMIKILILLITLLMNVVVLDAEIVRRAAFDFGSGKIKVQIADVDTATDQIVHIIHNNALTVKLGEDLAHHRGTNFSHEIIHEAIDVARTLKHEAIEAGATAFCGIATEAYRKASNSQDLIKLYEKELSIPVTIVSQEEEGKFGFYSLIEEKKLHPAQTVCWDIGGGSFQISYQDRNGQLQVYKGPFGRSTTKNAIIQHVKKLNPQSTYSPNPISWKDYESALRYLKNALPPVPEELKDKLKDPITEIIGISAHPGQLRTLGIYYQEDVRKHIEEHLNKADVQLVMDDPSYVVSDLILIEAIMQKLNIHDVTYIHTHSGSSSALLISKKFWAKP